MTQMKVRDIIAGCLLCAVLYCCKKQEVGFLSDKLFYRANPLVAIKGRVTTSAPLEVDGSTQPLNVELLAVRGENGQHVEALTKEYEIAIYKEEIRSTDVTLEMIKNKLGFANYKAFNVNSIGGRLEVTPASVYADTGTYAFDVEVSNVKGTRVVENVGKLRITPAVPFTITRTGFVSTSVPNQEVTFVNLPASAITTTVTRVEGPNRVIMKFVDKNNVAFKPSAGEVIPRPNSGTTLRYSFGQFDPYYPEIKTDTAFVHEYPDKVPAFPLFSLGGLNVYTNFYRIPNNFNSLNLNLNPEFGIRLFPFDKPYVTGTFIITNKLNTVTRN
jgi:hypothetical protein